jgi:hypothetical protein
MTLNLVLLATGFGAGIMAAALEWRRRDLKVERDWRAEQAAAPAPVPAPAPESRPLPVDGDYVTVFLDAKGEWRWTMRAANHEIIAGSGEGYRDQAHASSMALRVTGIIPTVRA